MKAKPCGGRNRGTIVLMSIRIGGEVANLLFGDGPDTRDARHMEKVP